MSDLSLTEGLDVLNRRALIAKWAIYLYIAAHSIVVLFDVAHIAGLVPLGDANDPYNKAIWIDVFSSLTFLASAICVAMWIYRAHANLFAAGIDGLAFTPGWSVGWFFVPFANLLKPFQAMRELWNVSHDVGNSFSKESPQQLTLWWTTFLSGNVLLNISSRLLAGNATGTQAFAAGLEAVASGVLIVSAMGLLRIINQVTAVQRSLMGVSTTFA